MFKNYIKTALRNIWRKKLYAFLNIAGLAIGFACSLLLLFYIQDELSFDRFHERSDSIYRIETDLITAERTMLAATTASAMGPMLKADFPEILNVIRFSSYGQRKIVQREGLHRQTNANRRAPNTYNLMRGDRGGCASYLEARMASCKWGADVRRTALAIRVGYAQ